MANKRFEIKRCLHRYEFLNEGQKDLFHSYAEQFFKGEIDSDSFYEDLKKSELIMSEMRGPTDYIGSDNALKEVFKDYIIENHIPALIQYVNKRPGPKE